MAKASSASSLIARSTLENRQVASETRELVTRPDAIYFDTNVLIATGWPSASAQLLQVIEQAEKLGFPLCLPDTVCKELEGHWIRELTEAWRSANERIERLNKQALSVARFNELPALPTLENLREELGKIVADFAGRFRIAPLTCRPLSEFLNLAINRGATFDERGRGFQDAIILCSVLDDMKANNFTTAILVSEDKAFQNRGVGELAKTACVVLNVLPTLDELQELVQSYLASAVLKNLKQEQTQLIEALKAQQQALQDYLVENFTVAPHELGGLRVVNKIESLEVADIENAHTAFGLDEGKKSKGSNSFKVSADVKVRLVLDVERYFDLARYWPSPENRLKVGGQVVQPPEPPPSLGSRFLDDMKAKFREVVIVVQAEATKTEAGYSDIRFTGAHLKKEGWGLGGLGNLLRGST